MKTWLVKIDFDNRRQSPPVIESMQNEGYQNQKLQQQILVSGYGQGSKELYPNI
jgi:hypothetical protein